MLPLYRVFLQHGLHQDVAQVAKMSLQYMLVPRLSGGIVDFESWRRRDDHA
jgi:hypothetical protein